MLSENDFYETFVKRHNNMIRQLCFVYARDADDLKDLMQEVIIQLWRSHQSFQGRSALSTWVYRVTLNVCLYYSKKISRRVDNLPLLQIDREAEQDDTEKERVEALYRAIRN